ncbi:MAG TPA: alpha/beta fold hydrolase [Hyphomonadaceae bacterium]|nr:alpha/beta fold hydrolase [Hyphomonadaceae bacterium]HPN07285.1 alpha/beta fold hydrolase [Hyphomonadaceae bacterium]
MPGILTFLPGTMCDQRVWQPVRQRLEPTFSTDYVAIETETTRQGMLDLIHSAALVGEPLHLVAFSMGGYLALEYALDNPGRVASLITVASSAFGLTEEEAAERVRALDLLAKHDYRGIPQARINQFVHPSHQADPAVADVIRAMDRDLGKPVLMAQLKETSTRVSLAPRLPELDIPVLLIGADSDPFVPWRSIERMGELIPHARILEAEDAGHMIPLEQPDWLASRIREFELSL